MLKKKIDVFAALPCDPCRNSVSRALAVAAVLLAIAGAGCSRNMPYRYVRPAVAFEMLHDSPNLLVVDLRSAESFKNGHVSGAVNIPLEQLEARWLEIAGFTHKSFLVYCQADECGEQEMQRVAGCGFNYPVLIEGGLDGWRQERFGIVAPDAEKSDGG